MSLGLKAVCLWYCQSCSSMFSAFKELKLTYFNARWVLEYMPLRRIDFLIVELASFSSCGFYPPPFSCATLQLLCCACLRAFEHIRVILSERLCFLRANPIVISHHSLSFLPTGRLSLIDPCISPSWALCLLSVSHGVIISLSAMVKVYSPEQWCLYSVRCSDSGF